ncbi:MAG: hypothetical protein ACLQA5_09160 [Solirubrobacteraceae bacterium]
MGCRGYRIVIEGEIGPRFAAAFDDMQVSVGDGKSELAGSIVDQSHLHGLLGRIADLGLTLVSVTPLDTNTRAPGGPHVE